jgi:hypothetical protein
MIELFQRNKIYDSAMGYKNNPQLVQNQAADFVFAQHLHNRHKCFDSYTSFFVIKRLCCHAISRPFFVTGIRNHRY